MLLDLRDIYEGSVVLDGKVYRRSNSGLHTGKFAVFLAESGSPICYKFFVLSQFISLKQVVALHEIHNLLAEYGLAPRSSRIVDVDVSTPGKLRKIHRPAVIKITCGFGLELAALTRISDGHAPKNDMKKMLDRLRLVCGRHRITRRGSVANIMRESRKPRNYLHTADGVFVIDIDPHWAIGGK